MRVKSLFFISLFCTFLWSAGDVFDSKLSRAKYGELTGVERVDAYVDALRAIHRGFASDAQVEDFSQAVLGMLKQRSLSNVQVLRSMFELVKMVIASKVSSLAEYKGVFGYWKEILEADLQKFALNHGEIIRVRFSQDKDNCFSVRMRNNVPVVENDRADGLSAFFRVILHGLDGSGAATKTIVGGDAIEFIPLYCERSGICCAFADEKALYCVASPTAQQKVVVSVCSPGEERLYAPLSVMKKDKNPLYVGEHVVLGLPGSEGFDSCVDRVSVDDIARLENQNLENALNRIKLIPSAGEKIDWMLALAPNLNDRISDKNYKQLFKLLSVVFGTRMTFEKDVLVMARKLLYLLRNKAALSEQKKYFSEWLTDINARLSAYALKYTDSLKISSASSQAVVSVLPHLVAGADGITKEFKVGVGARQPFAPGYDLCSLVSAAGKAGDICYGDEVEIAFPHIDEIGEIRCFVHSVGDSGKLVAASLGEIAADADMTFIVTAPLQGKDEILGPVVAEDECVLRSVKTGRVLGFLRGSGIESWVEIEPCERLGNLKNSIQFSFSKVVYGGVEKVVTQSFFRNLSQIKMEQSRLVQMEKMVRLLDGMSSKVSVDERNDFWDIVSLLVADKKHMVDAEIKYLGELLFKISAVAKANGFATWVARSEQAQMDLEFYKKMKWALSRPGMDRFKEMLQLAPEVKRVSRNEAAEFLEELRLLRKYKKDQSKAAKLLLMHVSDEVGQDSVATRSVSVDVARE